MGKIKGWKPRVKPDDPPNLPGFSDPELQEVHAAFKWRITPEAWRRLQVDDRALMLAYTMFMDTREAYAVEWRENRKKRGEPGEDPLAAMKRKMGM